MRTATRPSRSRSISTGRPASSSSSTSAPSERALEFVAGADTDLQLDGFANGDRFGHAVTGLGDVDGDGADDYAASAHLKTVGGQAQRGRVYAFSGATGDLLWSQKGEAGGDQFGFAIAGVGDGDGDGVPDLLVGARRLDNAGKSNTGRAYLLSGVDGAILWTFTGGATNDEVGSAVSGLGDIDDDGRPDTLVGAPGKLNGTGRVYALSGVDGSIIYATTGTAPGGRFGFALSGLDGRDRRQHA